MPTRHIMHALAALAQDHPPTRVFAALILAAALSVPGAAFAQGVLFDFEGPFLLDEGRTIKDHSLAFDADTGTWHLFYIRGVVGTVGTSSEQELGHAVSENLRSWFVLPSVITSDPGAWDSRNVWAPDVVRNATDDGWTMYYTGVDGSLLQRTGRADSNDLSLWTKFPSNPILEPDSTVYLWSPDLEVPALSAFRDPVLIEHGGMFHLLNTALVPDAVLSQERRGVVHRFTSTDRLNWTETSPLATNNQPFSGWREIESVQIIEDNGTWNMFFTLFGIQAVQYIQSNSFDSGWDFTTAQTIDFGIGAELTPLSAGTWLFTRHLPLIHEPFHPDGGEVFFTLRADTLRFDPGTGEPVITPTDPISLNWPTQSGTAFLGAPTFGDNQLERGESAVGAIGHGYLSSREFYNGPLGGVGALGAQLGESATGSIQSTWFTVGANDSLISFLMGGTDSTACSLRLVERVSMNPDSLVVRRDTPPPGFDDLGPSTWNVEDLVGAEVRIEVIDNATDGWIMVDHFRVWRTNLEPTDAPALRGAAASIVSVSPNPFNPRTRIEFELERSARARIEIHDLRGRRIAGIDLGSLPAGVHARVWDGNDDRGQAVSSGVYLVRLLSDGQASVGRKITLVR